MYSPWYPGGIGDTGLMVGVSVNWILLVPLLLFVRSLFKMLLVFGDCAYANVGCCMVENPRWLRAVLRAVGLLMGDGEIGSGKGDFGAP